jgi:hypothetical protein
MEAARFDDNINIVGLESHDPAGKQSLRVWNLEESLEG